MKRDLAVQIENVAEHLRQAILQAGGEINKLGESTYSTCLTLACRRTSFDRDSWRRCPGLRPR